MLEKLNRSCSGTSVDWTAWLASASWQKETKLILVGIDVVWCKCAMTNERKSQSVLLAVNLSAGCMCMTKVGTCICIV